MCAIASKACADIDSATVQPGPRPVPEVLLRCHHGWPSAASGIAQRVPTRTAASRLRQCLSWEDESRRYVVTDAYDRTWSEDEMIPAGSLITGPSRATLKSPGPSPTHSRGHQAGLVGLRRAVGRIRRRGDAWTDTCNRRAAARANPEALTPSREALPVPRPVRDGAGRAAKRFGEWEVAAGRSLVGGGQGDVFVVSRQGDDELYASKRLRNPSRRDRFEREVGTMRALRASGAPGAAGRRRRRDERQGREAVLCHAFLRGRVSPSGR